MNDLRDGLSSSTAKHGLISYGSVHERSAGHIGSLNSEVDLLEILTFVCRIPSVADVFFQNCSYRPDENIWSPKEMNGVLCFSADSALTNRRYVLCSY